MDDYVVALANATGAEIAVWKGTGFRAYDTDTIAQYRVSMAASALEAVTRAKLIRGQFLAPHASRLAKGG